ncbi:alpha/beta hydrolase family protein [Xylanimonas ulmi]|uniref:Prolyl oligopeptidase family protein n=1 Tax=Xylanimonas ulmi TaxID=228973 RepID=A0A4Q7LZA0_9MICO|nr:prolyl oligopeptidase family serine peptidase [Xylanibacterium ulmi]RZS60274.1 prolyl oligopeptidase family protein [Xylanibacterium ulmi]
MVLRTIASSASILVGLAVAGALAGPAWDPVPVVDHLRPTSSSTEIGGIEAGVADGRVHEVRTFPVRSSEVVIELDGAEVSAILREPVGAGGGLSGMVFVHGAGTGLASEAFLEQADQLASAGVVTLVPDKRLDTYTTWHRDYEAMADDYLRSVDYLRGVPGVDPDRVGVYGESEGTWVVPIMQVKDPRIAFTILVSAPVVEPRQQAAFAVDNYLRNTNVPQQVFRAIPRAVGIQLPTGLLDYADFDVRPWLERQTAPVLVVYGTGDPSMPIEQGSRQIIADTAVGGGAPVTVRFYDGANHGLRVGETLVAQFPRDMAAWVQGLPETATAEPRIAGAQPEQLYLASPVPHPRWWGNGDIIIGTALGGVGLLVVGPLVWGAVTVVLRLAAVGRGSLRARITPRLARGVWPLLFGLAAGAVATTAALVVYLMAVARLALNYKQDDLVVQGGWIGVRLLGLVTVVCAALLIGRARDLRQARRAGDRDAVVAAGWPAWLALSTMLAGAISLLLWQTYWGVFQLGI